MKINFTTSSSDEYRVRLPQNKWGEVIGIEVTVPERLVEKAWKHRREIVRFLGSVIR